MKPGQSCSQSEDWPLSNTGEAEDAEGTPNPLFSQLAADADSELSRRKEVLTGGQLTAAAAPSAPGERDVGMSTGQADVVLEYR